MKGVTFGSYHSYDDFNLILSQKIIGTPSPKTNVIDIAGGDGVLDLTEYFGKINLTSVTVNTSLGGWYRSDVLYSEYAYPFPITFSSAPSVEMMFQTRNQSAALLWTFSSSASNAQYYLPQCYLIRPTTGSGINGNINIIAKGTA